MRRKEEDCGCVEKTRTPLRKWGIKIIVILIIIITIPEFPT